MKKLLEELQKTDPECYEVIARGLEQVDIEYEEDIIQGACQRAVAARGWHQDVAGIGCEEYTWESAIHFQSAALSFVQSGWQDSPAKAILTAYLSAIRSQPCLS